MKKSEQRIVAVLGTSRSGSSFLGSWLHKCGLCIGNDLMGADDYINKKGYYEDRDFVEFHFEIERNKRNFVERIWKKIWLIPYNNTITPENLASGKALIQRKIKQNHQWGWKWPPTIAIWNSCWKEIINELELKDKMVIIGTFRHYQKNVLSHMKFVEVWRTSAKYHSVKCYFDYLHFKLFKNRWANFLLTDWINMNKILIDILQNDEYKMLILFDTDTLRAHSKGIFQLLHENFKLDLKYINPLDLYEEKLMNREVDIKYKLDKRLVEEATVVYNKLAKLRDAQGFINTNLHSTK